MKRHEFTSEEVAARAAKLLRSYSTFKTVKSVAGSALTQTKDRKLTLRGMLRDSYRRQYDK
jgi:hypothetical protein